MDKKKAGELIVAIIIAAMFISSYVTLTNFGTAPGQSTTTVPLTVYGQGIANGTVSGYGSPVSITVSCSNNSNNNATMSNVTTALTSLENNNSVSNFYNSGLNFDVALGNITSHDLYNYIKNSTAPVQFGCLNFTGPVYVSLPESISFTVGSQSVLLPINKTYVNTTLNLPLQDAIGTQIKLRVSALITANGTIYGPMNIAPI